MKNFIISNDSLLKALQFARLIAKQTGGRIATMPDFARMRTSKDFDNSLEWHSWIVPMTMLFLGTYKEKRLFVIAHHFGPLNTDDRLVKWQASGEKDKGSTREKYGFQGCPKITQKEFNALVEGKFGEVKTIDFDQYYLTFRRNLEGRHITTIDAWKDPLLAGLLGDEIVSFKRYLKKCFQISNAYAEKEKKDASASAKVLQLSLEDRYGWTLFITDSDAEKFEKFPNKPVGLMFLFQRPNFFVNHDLSVSTELHSNESLGYSRLLIINDEAGDTIELKYNPQVHWKHCLVPIEDEFNESFFSLVGEKDLFVEYPKNKDGAYMDTGERMFPLQELKKIGQPTTFTTHDCLFFLKYHIDEVKKIAPKGANSYTIIGDVEGRGTVKVPIQFYHATPSTEKRILRPEEVMNNFELLLEINGVLTPA